MTSQVKNIEGGRGGGYRTIEVARQKSDVSLSLGEWRKGVQKNRWGGR